MAIPKSQPNKQAVATNTKQAKTQEHNQPKDNDVQHRTAQEPRDAKTTGSLAKNAAQLGMSLLSSILESLPKDKPMVSAAQKGLKVVMAKQDGGGGKDQCDKSEGSGQKGRGWGGRPTTSFAQPNMGARRRGPNPLSEDGHR